jgi:hypothetical protein
LTGHHEVPEETNNRISPAFGIADKSGSIILPDINPDKDVIKPNINFFLSEVFIFPRD